MGAEGTGAMVSVVRDNTRGGKREAWFVATVGEYLSHIKQKDCFAEMSIFYISFNIEGQIFFTDLSYAYWNRGSRERTSDTLAG